MSTEFINKCRELGVNKLVFVRHANSQPISGGSRRDQPHDWKMRDQTRGLTVVGEGQIDKNKHLLSQFQIKAVLTSPARRASETAVKMVLPESGGDIFLRLIENLHPAGNFPLCEDLFDMMGYGPLRKFFDVPQGRDGFFAYAEAVANELANRIGGPSISEVQYGDTIAIFGHAVFLNAVAYAVALSGGIPETRVDDIILDADLGEAEAMALDFDEKTVTHLKS